MEHHRAAMVSKQGMGVHSEVTHPPQRDIEGTIFPPWFETVVGPIVLIRYSHFTDVGLSYSVALSDYLDTSTTVELTTLTLSWVGN